ncbi:PhpK family radical SAM P-methyltransferase [Amycolatopsis vastitatis]|uniref:PhpK family radical SAM P-methyltransferase n=1 Tax=Amycolatopsis vastitatis TaxID=1905142 RepID=UPI0013040106|nr:PhpK family radical SAM P-methyltransferase [Amycolatopsis vastitatis]
MDCLVIGYNEGDFTTSIDTARSKGADSPEFRVLQKNYVELDGQQLTYLDLINRLLDEKSPRADGARHHYNVSEVPNLAAVYLAANMRSRGFRCEFVSLWNAERDAVVELLETKTVRCVAITTTFYLTPFPVIDIVRQIKLASPGTIIVVGGPLVMNLQDEAMGDDLDDSLRYIGADVYVAESQGERTLADLLSALRHNLPLDQVPNVYLDRAGAFRLTTRKPENNSLDAWAIDWSLVTDRPLGPTLQTRTARSCAFKCAFCNYPTRAGALTLASMDTVERELTQMAKLGVTDVVFVDDTFNVPPGRFKTLISMMIEKHFEFRWYSYFRCSNVRDESIFDLIKESGCAGVFLGVESGDDAVLKNMDKAARRDQYIWSIKNLNERGIITFASFIAGFPGETDGTIENTIDFINTAQPRFYRIEPWWYNHQSPIRARSADFRLEGGGYAWKHASMDIHQAGDAVDRVFSQVRGSTWMPMQNFDFWSLPYLMGKGMTSDTILDFCKISQRLLASENRESRRDQTSRYRRELLDLMEDVRMLPSKYRT